MKLWYNNVALHALGLLRIGGERGELLPDGASPQMERKTLRIRFDFTADAPAWRALRAKIEAVRTAIGTNGNGRLVWVDDTASPEVTVLDTDARLVEHDIPDDPNAAGTYHQAVTLAFEYFDHAFSGGFVLTYTPAGASAVTLSNVFTFQKSETTDRYSPLRENRKHVGCVVTATGKVLVPDPSATLAVRRAFLIAQQAALESAFRSKSGTLVYSQGPTTPLNRVVRITQFIPKIDQMQTAIDWSLTAEFTLHPNEAGYSMAEYTASSARNAATGQRSVTLAGVIGAESAASAYAKLATIRTYHAAGMTRDGEEKTVEQWVDAVDGRDFLEVRFDETWRETAGTAIQWSVRYQDADDAARGVIRRTYRGFVVAAGATWQAAYQVATTRARALGDNLHEFKLSGTIEVADDQQSSDRIGTGELQVRVEFAYEYQLKGTRSFLDMSAEVALDTFGADSERVSGSIAAESRSAADTILANVRATFAGKLIRGERTMEGTIQIADDPGVTAVAVRTPPTAGAWGDLVNGTEGAGLTGMRKQFVRLDFSFEALRPKAADRLAIRYLLRTQINHLRLTRQSNLAGSISAPTRAAAQGVLDHILIGHELGTLVEESSGESREKWLGAQPATADNIPSNTSTADEAYEGVMTAYDFELSFRGAITDPADEVLEGEVSEENQYSGTRWVVQPTAFGRDVVQACGIQSGRRVVRGSVTATTEQTALNWARRHTAFPYSTATGMPTPAPTVRFVTPGYERLSPAYLPKAKGVARGGGEEIEGYNPDGDDADAVMWTVEFGYEEILPDYDRP